MFEIGSTSMYWLNPINLKRITKYYKQELLCVCLSFEALSMRYFAVHVAGQEWRVDPCVSPGVRLHAVATLCSQVWGQQSVLGAI